MEQTKIISAGRAYIFPVDEIRLTVLSMPNVLQNIQAAFGFQVTQLGTPPETFGSVPVTDPPGLVFRSGSLQDEEGTIPIRFIHVEQRRLVIDVAAPSSDIDHIYRVFREALGNIASPDGTPVLGEPTDVQDRSVITARLQVGLEAILLPSVLDVFTRFRH